MTETWRYPKMESLTTLLGLRTRKEMLNTVKQAKGRLELTKRKRRFKTSQQKEN